VCCTLGPHGPYRGSQNYNRQACGPFCSCKRRFSWISTVFVCMPQKNFQTVIHISLLNKQTYILLQIDREGSCVLKLEPLMQTCIYCRGEMKKKACSSRIARRWRNLTHNAALTVPSNVRLIKFSCVTCKREQSPSKFDTYSRQLRSTFGCQPDLNTLYACQLKSTFSAIRLIKMIIYPRFSGTVHEMRLVLN